MFANAEKISGEWQAEHYLVRNKGCFGCSIGCGRVTDIPKGPFKSAEKDLNMKPPGRLVPI
jgi:aldehyde:ferredoxin oxidoreductase